MDGTATLNGQGRCVSKHKSGRSALTDSLQASKGASEVVVPGSDGISSPSPPASSSGDSSGNISPWVAPDSFPCLFPDNVEVFDASAFQDDIRLSVSYGSGTPSAGWSLVNSLVGTPVADYEENPFSRRKPEVGRSPGNASWAIRGASRWQKMGSPSVEANYLSEQTIGSLPKPMNLADGMMSRNGSLTSRMLQTSVPMERVSARSLEGRALRRRLLKGKVVVFVSAGYSGKRFIYERAKELGVRGVLIDGPDSWSRMLEEEGIIEKFIPFDWSDNDTVFDRCVEAITRVERELGQVDGVMSFWEVAQPLVARLVERLGLPGSAPDSVDAARDKKRTRSLMHAAGLPTPRNFLIQSHADVEPAAEAVGFPAVIKPISGAASLGVVRVDSLESLRSAYTRALRDVAVIRLNERGDFVSADITEEEISKGGGNMKAAGSEAIAAVFLMEQYLDGPEVDVDIIVSEGEAVYGSITDNWPTLEPFFNETGSNCPSTLPLPQQRALCELAVQSVVTALHFRSGVFHVEAKYTSSGPQIIEVNARMGGGPVRDINKIVWGVDLVEEQLYASTGIPSKPIVARQPLKQIAEYSVNAKQTGIVLHTDFLSEWSKHPDVLYARPLVEAGDKVVCVDDGLPSWVYEMMVKKPRVEEAIEFVKLIEGSVPVPIGKA